MSKIYQQLAALIDARINCIKTKNNYWKDRHEKNILDIVNDYLPHGSGIDTGCNIDLDASNGNKLVIVSSYHAMNDNGLYDGWYDFVVKVTPSLHLGFDIKITGVFGKYQNIKDYLYETFDYALSEEMKD